MGRTMLFLGVMIMLSVVALLRLRDGGGEQTDSDAAPHLVQRDGEWRSAFPAGDLVRVDVERVIDGDTLEVRALDGSVLRVRLFGVNAPEIGERCADEAAALLETLAGDAVRLLADERLEDSGGRQLRYLFTPDGVSIDAALIVGGLARAWNANGALRERLVALETAAIGERRGCLWSEG